MVRSTPLCCLSGSLVVLMALTLGYPLKGGDEGQAPAPRPGMVKVLVLEQKVEGVPDQPPERPLHQKMLLDEANRRLILVVYRPDPPAAGAPDPDTVSDPLPARTVDRRIILLMNSTTPEITELWDAERTYRKTTRDLNTLQEERDRQEANILRHLNDLSNADRKAILEENFLRPDGQRIVDVVRGGTKKVLGFECQEVKIVENGRTVIDAWVTKDVPGAKGFFHLYRRLGAFSQEVLKRVAELEGLPLEASITVVTASPAYNLKATCLSVKTEEVPVTDFDLPAGYQEKKTDRDIPAVVPCDQDGKPVERAECRWKTMLRGGEMKYFCSKECMEAWNKEKTRQQKEEGTPDKIQPAGVK